MFTRTLFLIVAVLGCLLGPPGKAEDKAVNMLSKEEIKLILSIDMDLPSKEDIAKKEKLIAAGEKAYPVLVELLGQTNNPILISRILAVFIESKGEKAIPIEATKKLLTRFPGACNDHDSIRINVAMVLGKIGRSQDREALYGLLEDNDEFVRVNALCALSQLGSEADVARVQAFLKKRKARLTADEIRNDYSLREAEKVVQQLKRKVKALPSSPRSK